MDLIIILSTVFVLIAGLSFFKKKLKYFLVFCVIESLLVLFIAFYESRTYRFEIEIYGNILIYLIALIFLVYLLFVKIRHSQNPTDN